MTGERHARAPRQGAAADIENVAAPHCRGRTALLRCDEPARGARRTRAHRFAHVRAAGGRHSDAGSHLRRQLRPVGEEPFPDRDAARRLRECGPSRGRANRRHRGARGHEARLTWGVRRVEVPRAGPAGRGCDRSGHSRGVGGHVGRLRHRSGRTSRHRDGGVVGGGARGDRADRSRLGRGAGSRGGRPRSRRVGAGGNPGRMGPRGPLHARRAPERTRAALSGRTDLPVWPLLTGAVAVAALVWLAASLFARREL